MAWPNSQLRRVEQVIQNGVVAGTGTHTDFVVFISRVNIPDEMCSPTSANRAQSNGEDIRAAMNNDGTTQVEIDVIQWGYDTTDAAGDASILIAVKIDVATASDTSFWLAYNTSGSTAKDAATATFGSQNVYTQCELAALTDATSMTDRSGNHTLTSAGTPTNAVGSPLENYVQFGTDDRLSNSDAVLRDILTTYSTTVSIWVRDSAYVTGNYGAYSWEGTDDFVLYPYDDFEFGLGTDIQRVFWRDLSSGLLAADLVPAMTVDVFHLIHFTTRASNDHELLIDGTSESTSAATGTAGPFTTFWIGGFGATAQNLDADLAHVLVWKTSRSNDWCNTEYANQNAFSTFIVEGTPEAISGGGGSVLTRNYYDRMLAA